MAIDGILDYALARVQAQHGRRLNDSDWRRIEARRDLAHYLDALRMSTLAEWVSSIGLSDDSHAIERSLREQWRRYVESIASWHPLIWQPWLAWLAWLPTLSLLAALTRPQPAPSWMMADALFGPIAPGHPAERAVALRATALAALAPAFLNRIAISSLWYAHWRRLAPVVDADTGQLLEALQRAVGHYAAQVRGTRGAVEPREELAERLGKLFRRGGGTVAATVCHLALQALDLERLRGGLVARSVFDSDTHGIA